MSTKRRKVVAAAAADPLMEYGEECYHLEIGAGETYESAAYKWLEQACHSEATRGSHAMVKLYMDGATVNVNQHFKEVWDAASLEERSAFKEAYGTKVAIWARAGVQINAADLRRDVKWHFEQLGVGRNGKSTLEPSVKRAFDAAIAAFNAAFDAGVKAEVEAC